MPTLSINGIQVELSTGALAVAQQWMSPLQTAAKLLLDSASQFDARLQPALAPGQLASVFNGLIDELTRVTQLFQTRGVTADGTSVSLQTTVQDMIGRYIEGVISALRRLLDDWDALGPIFFTPGDIHPGPGFSLAQLAGLQPLPDALTQGGRPSLRLMLKLKPPDGSASLATALVYLPRDVERDYALMGSTSRLCIRGNRYMLAETPCAHPWCRSLSEALNKQLGEEAAIPVYTLWPARVASTPDQEGTSGAYGYREDLGGDGQRDTTVSSERAPEAAAFYRTLGRQLALAYAFCIPDLGTGDFAVQRLRPYLTGLERAFEVPLTALEDTGLFDPQSGPLAPVRGGGSGPPKFGLFVSGSSSGSGPAGAALVAANYTGDVKRGCAEMLEALASLSGDFRERFRAGIDLLSWFRPRIAEDAEDRQGGLLELLSAASSWSDWKALDGLTARWKTEDDEDWARHWFGGLLSQLTPTLPVWSKMPQEAMDALAPLRDQITGLLGVRTFQEIRVETVLALAPSERETLWGALVSLAQLLGGLINGTDWDPGLDSSWGALPVSTLVGFELSDHTRARLPYFVHRLQSASLWSGETGEEVKLTDHPDASPPRLSRETFFPEPMAEVLARRLELLKNEGVRIRLVSAIPALMTGGQATGLAAPSVGPAFQLTTSPGGR